VDSSSIKVTIAGSECTVVSSTTTQIKCQTGSYAFSSIKALIQVSIKDVGLAINVNKLFLSIFLFISTKLMFDLLMKRQMYISSTLIYGRLNLRGEVICHHKKAK
jgi:hypothetical protein